MEQAFKLEHFSLRWNNYFNQITEAFGSLRNEEDLVDVTLSCEGKKIKAHKMLLSACSSYFRDIFKENPCQHPVIVFRNVDYEDLQAIIDFIYKGEVNVKQQKLESFLNTAELLEIKGLTDDSGKDGLDENPNAQKRIEERPPQSTTRHSSFKRQPISYTSTPEEASSPAAKKRKASTSSSLVTPEQRIIEDEESVELKSEKEYYVEDLTFDEGEDNDGSDDLSNMEPAPPLRISSKQAGSKELNSNSRSQDSLDGSMLPLSQVRGDPGPSIDLLGHAQDCKSTPKDTITDDPVEVHGIDKSDDVGLHTKQPEPYLNKQSLASSETVRPTKDTAPTPKIPEPDASKGSQQVEEKMDTSEVKSNYQNQNTEIMKSVSKPVMKTKGVNFPKGLIITPVLKTNDEIQSMFDYASDNNIQSQDDEVLEEFSAPRSEDAKTPVQEDPLIHQSFSNQSTEVFDVTSSTGQILQEEPEMAEEAPAEQDAPEIPIEEEKEPEFDYYGCEICKGEKKAFDRFTFSHKCPICPCTCFCAHLLKEHMKVIHGWFNVQRRFTHY